MRSIAGVLVECQADWILAGCGDRRSARSLRLRVPATSRRPPREARSLAGSAGCTTRLGGQAGGQGCWSTGASAPRGGRRGS